MLEPSGVTLDGKVAIITGGGAGLGRAISETFAAFGAKVVIAEIDPVRAHATAQAIQARGGKVLPLIVDIREAGTAEQIATRTMAAFERIDILVNNVGDFLKLNKPFLQSTPAEWEALYHINLHHVFLCTHAIVPHMISASRGGSVINLSTIEAFRANPGMSVYSAFKSGITQFTRSFAVEVGHHGIRVNAIAPEKTSTPQMWSEETITDTQRRLIPYWLPIGRIGTPQDIAGAALFLASDLSQYVTGTTIHADGGALAGARWFRTGSGRFTSAPLGLDQM